MITSGGDENPNHLHTNDAKDIGGTKGTHQTWADVVKMSTHVNESNKNSVKFVSRSFSRNNPVNGTKV
jgi:hypothetical protein